MSKYKSLSYALAIAVACIGFVTTTSPVLAEEAGAAAGEAGHEMHGHADAAAEAGTHAVSEVAGNHGDDAHSDGGHEANITEFDPTTYLWELALFFALFAVLAFVVWPKMLEGLKSREEKQRGDLTAAEKAAQDAQAALAEYKAQLAEARAEAGRIVDEARTAATQAAAKVTADEEAKLATMRKRNTDEIESAKKQAIGEIYAQAAVVSTQIAGKILSREIRPEDQQQIINQSLQELTSTIAPNN